MSKRTLPAEERKSARSSPESNLAFNAGDTLDMQLEVPRLVAGVFIFNRKGELFLIRSPKWGGRWVVPGGKVEYGERLQDCAKREVKEETGLSISNIKLFNTQESIFPKDSRKKKHFVFFNFFAKAKSSKVTLNEEGTKHVWVAPQKALKLPLGSGTRMFIKKHL